MMSEITIPKLYISPSFFRRATFTLILSGAVQSKAENKTNNALTHISCMYIIFRGNNVSLLIKYAL